MTKNRTPTPVYLDPGMHPGLEVKGLKQNATTFNSIVFYAHTGTLSHRDYTGFFSDLPGF